MLDISVFIRILFFSLTGQGHCENRRSILNVTIFGVVGVGNVNICWIYFFLSLLNVSLQCFIKLIQYDLHVIGSIAQIKNKRKVLRTILNVVNIWSKVLMYIFIINYILYYSLLLFKICLW